MEVRTGGGEPASAPDVPVELREALLPVAVDVVGEREARLLHRGKERVEQWALGRPPLEGERAAVPAERVVRRGGEAVLHPLEVREAVREPPLVEARMRGPALEVERVSTLEDHPVDRRGAAEHLAARVEILRPARCGSGAPSYRQS